ncbi:MAG TPA: prepilin-type N-terminal cleavage/methylation domain-containing protein [Smithellaceae bacterium]|jgi:MSHA pilin protein MshC|nr:prepilin-type N-terminal cleavage/methylation domain-containing protein [Smithellaceae bacterium]
MIRKKTSIHSQLCNSKGFTMIEIVAVLIILGIIAAVAISRGLSVKDVTAQSEVETLKGHLRFAQSRAMNEISPIKWGIQVNGLSYTLVRNLSGDNATLDTPAYLPGESSATHTSTISGAGSGTVLFDDWGRPSATAITFVGRSISITPDTGFIE